MMKKLLSVLLVLVLGFSMILIPSVNAQAPYGVSDVDVDGTDLAQGDILYAERGETLNVRVELESDDAEWPEDPNNPGNPDEDYVARDVKIRVEIDGYEYDEIDDVTDMFDVEYGIKYVKHLRLTIPNDIDASETYNLRIRAYSREYSAEDEYSLRIKAARHRLNIMDTIFIPGLTIDAGQPLFTTVRVENLGDKKEEDIRVEISVPQLGRSGVTYIDELSADYVENDEEDIETSESSDAIYIDTRGASPGVYNVVVKVEYDRGHREITENYQLTINGAPTQVQNVLVDATETMKSTEAGQGVVYKIDIANMGSLARSFTAEVAGLDWGNFRVDPTLTVVQAGSSAEMFVYVSPNEDVTGQRTFTVNVMEGNDVVKQINFQMEIGESRSEWGNVLTGLEIGFIVLLIILVILGIILAATRMGRKEESDEPLGETYY
tara:strand:+ start:1159 stop:2466 length:1308 start_codon:yes stop_codon:yes gene_type:complete